MVQGGVRLTTGLAVGKRNRAAMEEATVFFRAFPDRETHTCFFPVRNQEGSNPLGGGLAVALALALSLGLAGESPFPVVVDGSETDPGPSALYVRLRSPLPPPEGPGGGLGGRGLACSRFAISPRQKAISLRESERLQPWSRMSSDTEAQTDLSARTISWRDGPRRDASMGGVRDRCRNLRNLSLNSS